MSKCEKSCPPYTPGVAAHVVEKCVLKDGEPTNIIIGYGSNGATVWVKDKATNTFIDKACAELEECPPAPVEVAEPVCAEVVNKPDTVLSVEVTNHPPQFDFDVSHTCGPDRTWVRTLVTWIDGVRQPDEVVDTGVSCDAPIPSDPEIKWVTDCVDGFETHQLCQVVYTFNDDGTIASSDTQNIGDPIVTNIECNVEPCDEPKIREGQTCGDDNYPDGIKVQWLEQIDCDGNVTQGEYFSWGSWESGGTLPAVTTLGSHGIVEGLATAEYITDPGVMDASYITGLPNNQVWVNFPAGGQVEGTFPTAWTVIAGNSNELIFEDIWNPTPGGTAMDVELLVNGSYVGPVSISTGTPTPWEALGTIANNYQFPSGGTGSGNGVHWVTALSFSDFGVNPGDVVTGVKITFQSSPGAPDIAGIYISDQAGTIGNGSLEPQPTQIVPIGCCPECEITTRETTGCATEAIAGVNVGDTILSLIREDCNGVPVEILQYNLDNNGALVEGSVFTEACNPQPDIETLRDCIVDANGVEWVQAQVIDPSDGSVVFSYFYQQDTLMIGTPAGEPNQWTACGGEVGTIIHREVCLDVDGVVLNAYAVLCVYKSLTTLLRYEDGLGNTVTGTPVNCTCDAVDVLPAVNRVEAAVIETLAKEA